MPGGVGGEEPRGSPLSRSLRQKTQSATGLGESPLDETCRPMTLLEPALCFVRPGGYPMSCSGPMTCGRTSSACRSTRWRHSPRRTSTSPRPPGTRGISRRSPWNWPPRSVVPGATSPHRSRRWTPQRTAGRARPGGVVTVPTRPTIAPGDRGGGVISARNPGLRVQAAPEDQGDQDEHGDPLRGADCAGRSRPRGACP